jgi:hypothetical protein
MADLGDGESVEVKGSGARPYVLRNVGGATISGRRRARYHGPGRGHSRSRSGPA